MEFVPEGIFDLLCLLQVGEGVRGGLRHLWLSKLFAGLRGECVNVSCFVHSFLSTTL